MQTVDEQPETIHLYVVRGTEPKLPLYPVVFSVLALFALVVYCALTPYRQPVTRITLRVPAVPLVVKMFTAQAVIVPTGIKTYPATTAHGVLTITNGSVIAQTLPAGLTFVSSSGVTVMTERATYVPPGSADGYGMSTVPAHVLTADINLSTLSINQTLGTSLYVRNLQPFTGGRPAYSVKVVTEEDRQLAVYKTRNVLATLSTGLHYPCNDVLNIGKETVSETWRCQFVTYQIADFYHVTGIKLVGKNLILSAWFVERPIYRQAK
jgi:hypothetical protein